jgi:cytochrome P450
MAELVISVLAALFGVLLDRMAGWRKAQDSAVLAQDRARLRRRLAAEQLNRRIDEEIAGETDLGAVVDRL